MKNVNFKFVMLCILARIVNSSMMKYGISIQTKKECERERTSEEGSRDRVDVPAEVIENNSKKKKETRTEEEGSKELRRVIQKNCGFKGCR